MGETQHKANRPATLSIVSPDAERGTLAERDYDKHRYAIWSALRISAMFALYEKERRVQLFVDEFRSKHIRRLMISTAPLKNQRASTVSLRCQLRQSHNSLPKCPAVRYAAPCFELAAVVSCRQARFERRS
jgi:hypothetical protein